MRDFKIISKIKYVKTKLNYVLFSIILMLLCFPCLLHANEISILPASISGEVPTFLGSKADASQEIAKLTRHYLKRDYLTEITEPKIVENFLNEENISNDFKISEQTLNLLCMEWDSTFVVKDSVDFGTTTLIQSEIYNCKNKSSQIIRSNLVSNFILSIEKHIEKSFRFLPPKFHAITSNADNINYEIHFLLDTNGSYSYYRKDFAKSINGLVNTQSLYMGLTLIRKNKILTLPPSTDHTEIKKTIDDIAWSGTNSGESLLQAVQSLRTKLSAGKKTTRKIFFLFSSVAREKSTALILALNELRQLGIELNLIIPNHSDLNVLRELQRLGRSTSAKILGITDFQRIGTEDGYSHIFLNQFNLYYTNQEVTQPFRLEEPPFKKYDASIVREASEMVTPYNMYQVYEKISEKRILEKSEVKTNIETLIGNEVIKPDNESDRYQSILLETKGEAIWLKVPLEINIIKGKEYLLQTSMFLDPFSTWGIRNIANETSILKVSSSYPKSLTILPSNAKKFIESNKIKQFSGYMRGVVSLVKKR